MAETISLLTSDSEDEPEAVQPPPTARDELEHMTDDMNEAQRNVFQLLLEMFGEHLKEQARRAVLAALGADDEIGPIATALLLGEMEDPEEVEDAERRDSARGGGAPLGSCIERRLLDSEGNPTWQQATVARYNADHGHLLKFWDGYEERVDLKDKEVVWRQVAASSSQACKSSNASEVDEDQRAAVERVCAPAAIRVLPDEAPPEETLQGGLRRQFCEEAG